MREMSDLPLPPLALPGCAARFLDERDIPLLQAFLEANPEYYLRVEGQPPGPGEAREIMFDVPPPEVAWSAKGVIGVIDAGGSILALAEVLSDLPEPGVWHIGLFILATARHGSGDARTILAWLEGWVRAHGAAWLRLGVVIGNRPAERFWERSGFLQTRVRRGVLLGTCSCDVRAMVKPLAGGRLADYLALVARDRPEA